MKPAVSVILPVRNGAASVRKAVESVLGQKFRDLELLVVDDASTDATPQIIKGLAKRDPRIRCLRRARSTGIVGALNKGMAHARGEFIARIDHDDEWISAAKLAEQMKVLRMDPKLGLIGTGMLAVRERTGRKSVRRVPISDPEIRRRMLMACPFVHSSVVFRKAAAAAAGGYRAAYPHSEDYYLWLRMGRKWRFANLDRIYVRYWWRRGGVSATNRFMQWTSRLRLIFRFRNEYPGAYRAFAANVVWAVRDVALTPLRWLWDLVSIWLL